ncbi:hypothetical protein M2103_002246 [Ereboglobus sp. PH5-5]|uniref:DUF2752 domain-containing protein n=1 Tax=Ereboglobus sp. PH5-5 TaxID=2940529 RepID=UPI00240737E6|nr:DUF2752 domain-containing protein [Ereboglobus sp. PH5-5]MDF9834011.1 hypothetical protein [Ereboglobus sp. PH5-5]
MAQEQRDKPASGWLRAAAIILPLLMLAGFAWVRLAGPVPPAWYPPCPLHALTGLFCPGCGSARVFHDLAHGNFRAACGHNLLIVAAIPFIVVWGVRSLNRVLRRNLPPQQVSPGLARVVLVAVVGFMLARNLPWWPFTLLAPGP